MMPEDIIIAPVVTEKSNDEIQFGKYTFKVNKKALTFLVCRRIRPLLTGNELNCMDLYYNHSLKGNEHLVNSTF